MKTIVITDSNRKDYEDSCNIFLSGLRKDQIISIINKDSDNFFGIQIIYNE